MNNRDCGGSSASQRKPIDYTMRSPGSCEPRPSGGGRESNLGFIRRRSDGPTNDETVCKKGLSMAGNASHLTSPNAVDLGKRHFVLGVGWSPGG